MTARPHPHRAACALALWMACALPAPAEPPSPGLLWNRTGLPATFPLQVKTPPGQDFRLTLLFEDTATPALAAYIPGGAFFRVLVPPGRFVLHFEHGKTWQSDEDGFESGPDSGSFLLSDPLTFAIGPSSTKRGHIVDLTGFKPGTSLDARIRDQVICQSAQLDSDPDFPHPPTGPLPRNDGQGRVDRADLSEPPFPPGPLERDAEFRRDPRLETRSRYCD